MEVYSPERVCKVANEHGLVGGASIDLKTGWDLSRESDRGKMWRVIEHDRPKTIIVSPECTMFSKLQRLTKWSTAKQVRYDAAVSHIKIAMEICTHQIRNGKYFVYEHPAHVDSWKLKEVQ